MEETTQPERIPADLADLRARIDSGRYEVDPRRVAEAMLAAGIIGPPGRSARPD